MRYRYYNKKIVVGVAVIIALMAIMLTYSIIKAPKNIKYKPIDGNRLDQHTNKETGSNSGGVGKGIEYDTTDHPEYEENTEETKGLGDIDTGRKINPWQNDETTWTHDSINDGETIEEELTLGMEDVDLNSWVDPIYRKSDKEILNEITDYLNREILNIGYINIFTVGRSTEYIKIDVSRVKTEILKMDYYNTVIKTKGMDKEIVNQWNKVYSETRKYKIIINQLIVESNLDTIKEKLMDLDIIDSISNFIEVADEYKDNTMPIIDGSINEILGGTPEEELIELEVE